MKIIILSFLLLLGFFGGAATFAQTPKYPQDFDTLMVAGNTAPWSIWSDGTTMWVVDNADDKIYAYNMQTKARDPDKDFDDFGDVSLSQTGLTAGDLWSDGTTLWLSFLPNSRHYAFDLATKNRKPAEEFPAPLRPITRPRQPTGIWSDGAIMWFADYYDNKIYAFNKTSKLRLIRPPRISFDRGGVAGVGGTLV